MDLTCPRLLADAEGLFCRDNRVADPRIRNDACALCVWRHQKPTRGLRASPDGSLEAVPPVARRPPPHEPPKIALGSRQRAVGSGQCAHRSEEVRQIVCASCGGNKTRVKVFACALHGECVLGRSQAGVRGCKGGNESPGPCGDYETRYNLPDITFGITAFERPMHLEKLVASIKTFYPGVRIVVVDNGRHKARLPPDVELVNLEFNCGLSAARNALIDRLATKYLFLLEDDFEFTAETKAELLIDILEHHPEVGCAGGSLCNNGNLQDYAVDMHLFQGTLHGYKSTGQIRVTDAGTPYRLCDKIYNFGLWRREILLEHRWPEDIKLQEHTTYFWRVKKSGKWLVAHCAAVKANHDQSGRDKRYNYYRNDTAAYRKRWYASDGIKEFCQQGSLNNRYRQPDRSNVLVMGVGHSRTTVLTRMLESLGWNLPEADENFAEHVAIREQNKDLILAGTPLANVASLLNGLPTPWAVKDPRFVITLDRWLPALSSLDHPPLLVWIVRDSAELEASYRRRRLLVDGELTLDYQQGWTLERLQAEAQRQFDRYPWNKIKITDTELGQASGLFRRPPSMQIIPKVFHRVWLGGQPMPPEYVDFGAGWLKLNPDWEMREWSEANLPPLITGDLIREARNYSQASDILRYELLHRFGGVYLDTDFEALKPIGPWLCGHSWVGAGEDPDMVSAGFIACTAQHPITAAVLELLPERIRGDLPQATATGPGLLTEVWRRFQHEPGVQAYGPRLFYPYRYTEKHRRHDKFPGAVAVHHWAGSWLDK